MAKKKTAREKKTVGAPRAGKVDGIEMGEGVSFHGPTLSLSPSKPLTAKRVFELASGKGKK